MSKGGGIYVAGDSWVHRLDGAVKLILWLIWTVVVFMFLDLRLFAVMIAIGVALLWSARIPLRKMAFLFWFLIFFTFTNAIFILLITPTFGTTLTGTNTPLIPLGYNTINKETLFYVLTLSAKYITLLPLTLVFILTTHPSRFAASLNKVGVPYKIAYAVSIAFRYIPDLTQEFKHILNSLSARGLGITKEDGTIAQRMKNLTLVVVPLLQSSLHHIDAVSNAMDLRGFGAHPKRTWYMGMKMSSVDKTVLLFILLLLALAIYLKVSVLKGFWYPL
ncbi:energy-coupling factor transport system permease protein [Paenibacillus shirakamiensis]|uniref:Energy-coupling factor transport system permease protein n=1 Tax=Paenibacillus shirakamiensis TaxID=1265935 RepID=A0ABS4JL92_9BACL|nr:energy-coupling factor transporter transmembrane component T [Paenibacillus shirakamiensis]MBP2001841.1 energy-coupling factor transport system permease protein [Paenibacillus shirakamiensis]